MKTLFLTLLIFIHFISCTPKAEEKINMHLDMENYSAPSDSIVISGKSVTFFLLSQNEMPDANNDSIHNLFSDFQYYGGQVIEQLEEQNINALFSSARYFEIVMNGGKINVVFDRIKAREQLGMIISDGTKPPKFVFMIATPDDYMKEILSYFEGL
jgi:hypothetical protein